MLFVVAARNQYISPRFNKEFRNFQSRPVCPTFKETAEETIKGC